MKKFISLLIALMLFALPAMAETLDLPAADGATLTVTGSASVTLKADYARVQVGVSTKAATVEEATALNGAAIRNVIAALTEAGIAEDDIATSNYSVYAEYDYSSGESVQSGFNVSNQLNVIIRDMTAIGATLDKATSAGANNVYNVEFLSTASDSARDEALTYAVKEAYRKAKLLASAAGLAPGSVISITDNAMGGGSIVATFKSQSLRDATNNVILPDDLSVSASVTVVFALTEAQ